MNKPLRLSEKNTEDVLSSVVFLISCVERVENRLRLLERRVRDIEVDHERTMRRLDTAAAAPAIASAKAASVAAHATLQRIAVVVPVHNAPQDTEACLLSIFENGGYSRLVVIDDASEKPTADLLDAMAERREFTLIRNPKNLGYTKSINIGIRNIGDAEAAVILNSDTVVTADWLKRIRHAFNANPRVGIVGPWSNAATYQSVPAVKDGTGQFAINAIPKAMAPDDWSVALNGLEPKYPRVPIINGFCFAVRKAVFDGIGEFDEAAFPIGYGEENDFCLRTSAAGFEIAVADNAFVFHAKSRSFGAARRKELAIAGRKALDAKHGATRVKNTINSMERTAALNAARQSASALVNKAKPGSLFASFKDSIAYVLPAKPGGGGVHSVMQEASFLAAQGIKTTVFVPSAEVASFHAFYGETSQTLVTGYRSIHELHLRLKSWRVVVATVYKSVALVRDLVGMIPARFFYYVQDYEPFFHSEGSREYREALASYDIDASWTLFAKTKWLQQTVRELHGRDVRVVLPSLDHDVFRPAKSLRKHNRVTAMVRPSTPRRSPVETVALAEKLATRKGKPFSVALFGCDVDDPALDAVRDVKGVELLGRLKRKEVADLMRRSDVFVDLSTYQAFGRASIEGMACGAVPIVPTRGGSGEFAVPGWNSFAVDVAERDHLKRTVANIDAIYGDLPRFRANALATAARYSVKGAATSILKTFMQP